MRFVFTYRLAASSAASPSSSSIFTLYLPSVKQMCQRVRAGIYTNVYICICVTKTPCPLGVPAISASSPLPVPISTTMSSSSTVAAIPCQYASLRSESYPTRLSSAIPRNINSAAKTGRFKGRGSTCKKARTMINFCCLEHIKVIRWRGTGASSLPALHAKPLHTILVSANKRHFFPAVLNFEFLFLLRSNLSERSKQH